MRTQSDINKQSGVNLNTKQAVDQMAKRNDVQYYLNSDIKIAKGIVQTSNFNGKGSIVDLELLTSTGTSTGAFEYDVKCFDSRLAIGDIVSFYRRPDDSIEIISGGGTSTVSGATSAVVSVTFRHSHQGFSDGSWAGFLSGS